MGPPAVAARQPPTSKKAIRDASIMATNNSCIVSKRSVEKIYHKQDHGFRHFVKKFQRRSPLINRGYWLRMRAVDTAVRSFLQQQHAAGQPCAVVNLGCGYDVLPFRFLSEEPEICQNAIFLDVDYPDLMLKKCAVIIEDPVMLQLLGQPRSPVADKQHPAMLLATSQYAAIGCDLEDTHTLDSVLRLLPGLSSGAILFVAEVSITYMGTDAADAVIQWASGYAMAEFCLLEQCLPDGVDTGYATTMLKHFEKLNSPLKSVLRYQTMQGQVRRFLDRGWADARAITMWDAWQDRSFLPLGEAEALDLIEPFDEWEEFALFANHYFVLSASMRHAQRHDEGTAWTPASISRPLALKPFDVTSSSVDRRRNAAVLRVSTGLIVYHGGLGARGRLKDMQLIAPCPDTEVDSTIGVSIGTPPTDEIMCHSITTASDHTEALLVGGRFSPERALSKTYWRQDSKWQRVSDIPIGRFRHCAAAVRLPSPEATADEFGVLVFGGRTGEGALLGDWLLWTHRLGWKTLRVTGAPPSARFGAAMTSSEKLVQGCSKGWLTGGMASGGRILQDLWEWKLIKEEDSIIVACQNLTERLQLDGLHRDIFGRFGATLEVASGKVDGPHELYLIGGVAQTNIGPSQEILSIEYNSLEVCAVTPSQNTWKRIMVGHSTTICHGPDTSDLLVLGGGATCFSFGTFWNESGSIALDPSKSRAWRSIGHVSQMSVPTSTTIEDKAPDNNVTSIQVAPRRHLQSEQGFLDVLHAAQPMIFEQIDLGDCTKSWAHDYLRAKIGEDLPASPNHRLKR